MSISDSDRVLIHKYIKGTLNNNDMKLFRVQSKRKDFRKELLENISVLKNINDANKEELLNKFEYINLTNPIKEDDESSTDRDKIVLLTPSEGKEKSTSKALVFSLLVLAILSALGTWIYSNTKSTMDVRHYASLYIESSVISDDFGDVNRGNDSRDIDEHRIEFESKIKEGLAQNDYELISAEFENFNSQLNLSFEEKFVWASSLMKLGKMEKAIDLYSEVIENKKEFYIESLWYRGLCFGALNNEEQMKSDFTEIKSRSKYQSQKINTLLKHLSQLH